MFLPNLMDKNLNAITPFDGQRGHLFGFYFIKYAKLNHLWVAEKSSFFGNNFVME